MIRLRRSHLAVGLDPNGELARAQRRSRLPGANAGFQPDVTIKLTPSSPGLGQEFTITGKATLDGIPLIGKTVALLVDGKAIGSATLTAKGYSFKYSINSFGSHVIQATVALTLLRQKNSVSQTIQIQPNIVLDPKQQGTQGAVNVGVQITDSETGQPVATPYTATVTNPDGTQLIQKQDSTDPGGQGMFAFIPVQLGAHTITLQVGNYQTQAIFTVNSIGQPATTSGPLTVSLTASPVSGYPPLNVTVTAKIQGGVAPYVARFGFDDNGNGDTDWLPITSAGHQYATKGVYIITVQVKDSQGLWVQSTVPVTINPPGGTDTSTGGTTPTNPNPGGTTTTGAPLQSLSVTADVQTGMAPLKVNFHAVPVGGTAGSIKYGYDYGDGSPPLIQSDIPDATHIYQTQGTYQVTVSAKDTVTNSTQKSQLQITVVGPQQAVPITSVLLTAQPGEAKVPADIVFNAVVQGGTPPFKYTFFYGDGTHSAVLDAPTSENIYYNAETLQPFVQVTDSKGQFAQGQTAIIIDAGPSANVPVNYGDVQLVSTLDPYYNPTSGDIEWVISAQNRRSDVIIAGVLQSIMYSMPDGTQISMINRNITINAGKAVTQAFASKPTHQPGTYKIVTKFWYQSQEIASEIIKQVTI